VITAPLQFFRPEEFRHPELVDDGCAQFLDRVRALYGQPITLTSDARTPEEEIAALADAPEESGKAADLLAQTVASSLHVQGRAFDLHWPAHAEDRYALLWTLMRQAFTAQLILELEPVPTHLHVGIFPAGTPHGSRLIFG
jgi:hypothetical protein